MTTTRLEDLADSTGYDHELVLAYARIHKCHYGIDRFEKMLDCFEATLQVEG